MVWYGTVPGYSLAPLTVILQYIIIILLLLLVCSSSVGSASAFFVVSPRGTISFLGCSRLGAAEALTSA